MLEYIAASCSSFEQDQTTQTGSSNRIATVIVASTIKEQAQAPSHRQPVTETQVAVMRSNLRRIAADAVPKKFM